MLRGLTKSAVLLVLFGIALYAQYQIIGVRFDHWLIKFGYSIQTDDSPLWVITGTVIWFGFFTVLTSSWIKVSNYPFDTAGEQPLWLILLSLVLAVGYSFGLSFAFDLLDTERFALVCAILDGTALLCIPIRIWRWFSCWLFITRAERAAHAVHLQHKEKFNEAVP